MARPIVHPTTDLLYDALGSGFTSQDEDNDWALLRFLEEAVGVSLGEIDDIIRDSDDGVGWAAIMDVDVVPAKNLDWLAQFIGGTVPVGVSEAEQRARVKEAEGFKRGTLAAITQAAKSFLTGTQKVNVFERDGSAYRLKVQTYLAQTPDAAKVEAEVRKQKPGGIVLTFEVVPGESWQVVKDNFATWQDVKDTFATWSDLRTWVAP